MIDVQSMTDIDALRRVRATAQELQAAAAERGDAVDFCYFERMSGAAGFRLLELYAPLS